MKMVFDDVEEKYKYSFSVGELYEFGSCVLKDVKSPFDDVFRTFYILTFSECENVSRWAVGASGSIYESLEELKKDFLCWYGVNVPREG